MSEEAIRASPAATLNLFEDNRLRVLNVRHRDGIVKIEDSQINLPVGGLMDAGPSLERVPRVPGTRDILSSYVMAPVNFSEISG